MSTAAHHRACTSWTQYSLFPVDLHSITSHIHPCIPDLPARASLPLAQGAAEVQLHICSLVFQIPQLTGR